MSEAFTELLERLGNGEVDTVTGCHTPAGGEFNAVWTTAAEDPEVAGDPGWGWFR